MKSLARVVLFTLPTLLLASMAFAQAPTTATLKGHVSDASTHEAVIGARVELREIHRGAIADLNGNYVIKDLPPGPCDVEVHLLGYQLLKQQVTLTAGETAVLDFALHSAIGNDREITVQSEREREIERTSVSRITLTPATIEQVPSVGGESDLFRVLQLMPGVKALSEVSSGLYIRGGAPDQNLILLDHNTVYNPSHLFGFFSTFNTDAIKDVDLSKGGYPPEYGGRLTGVLNVTTREGDQNEIHGKTSLSVISAKQTLEFPLPGGSALVSGRRTYIDAFLNATNADSWLGGGTALPRYYFYDLNAKIDEHLGSSDHLSISGYMGSDHLNYPLNSAVDIDLTWGNKLASAEWTHIFSDKFFTRTFAGYSEYSSTSTGKLLSNPFEFDNGIKESSIKEDIEWRADDRTLCRFGASISRFNFNFFNTLGTSNKPLKDTGGVPYYLAAYAQDEWKPVDPLTITYGLRAEWLDLANAMTLDPRITVAYQVSPAWTLKASSGIYHQFLHLVSAGEFTFFDLWIPGTAPLPPSKNTQFIFGLSGYPSENYFFSAEVYYKKLDNIVEYNETKFLSNSIEEIFPRGTGQAYGMELFLREQYKDFTGWIGYTLSWVNETIPSMNNGVQFYPKYDQRHDIQLVLNYKLSESWQLGGTWTYATGQAYTSTLGYYHVALDEVGFQESLDVPGTMGATRLPDYHRADASVTYSFHLFGKPAKASLDIFNIYSHRNVWFRVVDTGKQPAVVSDVTLLPIIPTLGMEVSY